MPLPSINNHIKAIQKAIPGYISALSSGYLLIGANMLVQFALTPFYLKYLGVHQFGLLMMLLNLINFAAVGIGWMSGGLVRVMGERWANNDYQGFRNAFVVGKYVYTFYAIGVFTLIVGGWWLGWELRIVKEPISAATLLAGLYFILMYENVPERQAFVSANRQATGNLLELARIMLFVILIWILLPHLQDMAAVWIAMISGILLQRIATGYYWSQQVAGVGWDYFRPEMKPIFKRLVGKQGAGYFSYGVLLLISQADTIIIGFLAGPEAAGQFVLLWKIPEAIALLLWRIPSTIEPRVIQLETLGEREKLRDLFVKGRRGFFLLVATVSLAYMAFGYWLAELWVGEYAPQEEWMYVVAGFALFFNSFARWPISFAHALVCLKDLCKVAAFEVVFKIVFVFATFSLLGIASPLIGLIVAHVIYVAYAYNKILAKRGFV